MVYAEKLVRVKRLLVELFDAAPHVLMALPHFELQLVQQQIDRPRSPLLDHQLHVWRSYPLACRRLMAAYYKCIQPRANDTLKPLLAPELP